MRNRAPSLDRVAAVSVASVDLSGGDEPRRLMGGVVSPELHEWLGVRPLVGRLFAPGDGRATEGHVVLLGEKLWRSAFGADPRIVGRTITLDRVPCTVVGVLPGYPVMPPAADLTVPIGPDLLAKTRVRRHRLVAHLAPGSTIEQANRDLEQFSASLAAANPADNAGVRLFAEDLRTDLLDDNR